MTALEAKERARNHNIKSTESQYTKIIAKIDEESGKGHYEMWWYDAIHKEVRDKLTENGYVVHSAQFDKEGSLTKIEWKS